MTEPQGIRVRAHTCVMWRRIRIPGASWGIPVWPMKYYAVEIIGEGWTQARRDPLDVIYMACDYMACKNDKDFRNYYVKHITWIDHTKR